MKFNIYEITSIKNFDAITSQIDRYADNLGKPLDNNRAWRKAHTLVTEADWGERKATHMMWRRVQALLGDAVATL